MNTPASLRRDLDSYLELRRSLGFKLRGEEQLLAQFISYLGEQGTETITVQAALDWAVLPGKASPRWHARRLSAVRMFASHLHASDPRTEVPPPGLLRGGNRRPAPYAYADSDIAALAAAADTFRYPLLRLTYKALTGLLWVTGLRISEALTLDDRDLDTSRGLLTVRDTKFGKTRLIPLHPSTVTALRGYITRRDQIRPRTATTALFVNVSGGRLGIRSVHYAWPLLAARAGLESLPGARRPRAYDVRHAFAVRTLLGWYRSGADVPALLPRLSTYMGHTDPKHTYWYLSASPELLSLAAARLGAHLGGTS
jgi:integrase/recombinase XerD